MVCTFYHGGFKECTNSYCYYENTNEVDCPIKTEHIKNTSHLKINPPPPREDGNPRRIWGKPGTVFKEEQYDRIKVSRNGIGNVGIDEEN